MKTDQVINMFLAGYVRSCDTGEIAKHVAQHIRYVFDEEPPADLEQRINNKLEKIANFAESVW